MADSTFPETAVLLARCRFPEPGTDVTCAVSGGPDSLALLVLACASGLHVTAAHVDHGLRPESAGEGAVITLIAFSSVFPGLGRPHSRYLRNRHAPTA